MSKTKCEDCGKVQKSKSLIEFKGKLRCYHCKLKASKSNGRIPKPNPSENTLKQIKTGTPRGRPKLPGIRFSLPTSQTIKPDKAFWDGLTYQENKILWKHLKEQGFSDLECDKKMKRIKRQIKKSHEKFKEGLVKNKLDFKTAFSLLVEGKR